MKPGHLLAAALVLSSFSSVAFAQSWNRSAQRAMISSASRSA